MPGEQWCSIVLHFTQHITVIVNFKTCASSIAGLGIGTHADKRTSRNQTPASLCTPLYQHCLIHACVAATQIEGLTNLHNVRPLKPTAL